MTFEPVVGVTVCVLCGPAPALPEIETQIHKYWKNTYNLMSSLLSVHPRGFPPVQMDPNVIGYGEITYMAHTVRVEHDKTLAL